MDSIARLTAALLQLGLELSSAGAALPAALSGLPEPIALAVLAVAMFAGAHTARRQPATRLDEIHQAGERRLGRSAALSTSGS